MYKKHSVSVLLYHPVCSTKYRKAVETAVVDEKLKEICAHIVLRYEIDLLEIRTHSDHVHFFAACGANICLTKIVWTIKSITAKKIFRQMPEVKKHL